MLQGAADGKWEAGYAEPMRAKPNQRGVSWGSNRINQDRCAGTRLGTSAPPTQKASLLRTSQVVQVVSGALDMKVFRMNKKGVIV